MTQFALLFIGKSMYPELIRGCSMERKTYDFFGNIANDFSRYPEMFFDPSLDYTGHAFTVINRDKPSHIRFCGSVFVTEIPLYSFSEEFPDYKNRG